MNQQTVLAALSGVAFSCAVASGQNWTFTRLADETTVAPGATAAFNELGAPAVNEQGVSFWGRSYIGGTTLQEGVYQHTGVGLVRIADRSSPGPFGQPLANLSLHVAAGAGSTGFGDRSGYESTSRGLYRWNGSSVVRITEVGDPVPGSPGQQWTAFGGLSVDGSTGAYAGTLAGFGSFTHLMGFQGSTRSLLIVPGSPQPNSPGGFFNYFGPATATGGGIVAFQGIGGGPVSMRGIYTVPLSGGTPSVVADMTSPVPGRPGAAFWSFHGLGEFVDTDGATVAFLSTYTSGTGVYTTQGPGALRRVFDTEMPIPGRNDFFTGFTSVTVFGDSVAFVGGNASYRALMLDRAGQLETVIALGQVLDGRIVGDFLIGNSSLYGDTLAFWVGFMDGTEAVYSARSIPGAGTVATLLMGSLCLGRRRRGA